jgi:hypothetical protein
VGETRSVEAAEAAEEAEEGGTGTPAGKRVAYVLMRMMERMAGGAQRRRCG